MGCDAIDLSAVKRWVEELNGNPSLFPDALLAWSCGGLASEDGEG